MSQPVSTVNYPTYHKISSTWKIDLRGNEFTASNDQTETTQ